MLPLLLLVVWAVGTVLLSTRFGAPHAPADEPIEVFVGWQVLGGVAWLWALYALGRSARVRLVPVVVGGGLLLRLLFFLSTPILENDHQRYLWDGAVVARGLDPYLHAPAALLDDASAAGPEWEALVAEGRGVLEAVNHPHLATIYPPVAEGAFAVAHHLAPFKPLGLRVVWLLLDLAVLLLLARGLGAVPDRAWQLSIYWWNPLLVKEVYNSLHMEPVLLAFLTAALVWAGRRRILAASTALGFAIGAKLWPALWLPLILRQRGLRPRVVLAGAAIATVLAAVLLLPLVRHGVEGASGLGAYARGWEMNDSAFVLLQGLAGLVVPADPAFAARVALGVLLLGLLVLLLRRPVENAQDLTRRALVLVAALFLLSPTQYPWYFLWCLPVLALRPSFALLLLTVTLPLYYLRFRFVEWGIPGWFDYGLVWLIFVPTWILLGLEFRRTRRRPIAKGC